MKPDKHKQKQSAKYKKKHGMATDPEKREGKKKTSQGQRDATKGKGSADSGKTVTLGDVLAAKNVPQPKDKSSGEESGVRTFVQEICNVMNIQVSELYTTLWDCIVGALPMMQRGLRCVLCSA